MSKNKEVDNYCKSSNETIDKIIKGKVQRQLDLDTISEEVFWDFFSNTVKENLISMDNLFQKKIDNLIMNNEYDQNTQYTTLLKQLKPLSSVIKKMISNYFTISLKNVEKRKKKLI